MKKSIICFTVPDWKNKFIKWKRKDNDMFHTIVVTTPPLFENKADARFEIDENGNKYNYDAKPVKVKVTIEEEEC